MWLPPWLWFGSSLKFQLWLGNRLATWFGMRYAWNRWRMRHRWLLVFLINILSLGLLLLVFFLIREKR